MLKELKIENLAIIDELDIQLDKGLTVLTGETGAGKSIILDGISLIIGEKADKSLIGNRSNKVSVESVFELNDDQIKRINELGYDFEDEELIVTREIGSENKLRINGKRYNLTSLKEISSNILDIVGQHDHQYLLNPNYHLSLLDKFIVKESYKVKENLKKCIDEIYKLEEEIKNIEKEKNDILEKKDLYSFIIEEISNMKLKVGEEEELEEEYNVLFNAGSIIDKLEIVGRYFENMNLGSINRELEKLSEYNEEFNNLYLRFDNIYTELNDISSEIFSKISDINQDPIRLEYVSNRLDDIKSLKRKYGYEIEELIDYANKLNEKLDMLEFSSDILDDKKLKRENLLIEYEKLANELSKIRKNKSNELKINVKKELLELNMPNVEFDIEFTQVDKISYNGIDSIKFLMSTNKGEKLKDLSKIASGGEISRIMLALKVVFYKVDNISCLIFDEIDTGISGETVIKIANKLKQLSKEVQIICVTHSPQIAAKADNQYLIYKEIKGDVTNTKLKKLDYDSRVKEIARILSGDNISKASLEIAKEMMK